MYTCIYIFRVKKKNVDEFLSIQQDAAKIYLDHGAILDETYRASNMTAKYGCVAFSDAMDVDENEEVLVSLSGFQNQAHHKNTMHKVNSDPRILELFDKATKVIALNRTVYGEFDLIE